MRFNYAASLSFTGQFDAAEAQFEAAIELNPRFVKAHSSLSSVRTQTPERNHVARLEALLAGTTDSADRLHLHYALAKEHEDLKNRDAVFHHLDTANRRRKAGLGYDIAWDRAIFDRAARALFQPSLSYCSPAMAHAHQPPRRHPYSYSACRAQGRPWSIESSRRIPTWNRPASCR